MTVVQICNSFVYRLSILIIETEFVVLALKKRAYLRVIISLVQLSFPLLSLCQVFVPWLIVCAIHITPHFTAHEAQILIFWRMCAIFFIIKKGQIFVFRFRIFVEVESRDFGGFCIYQTYMLTFCVKNFGLINYWQDNILLFHFRKALFWNNFFRYGVLIEIYVALFPVYCEIFQSRQ